MTTLDILDDLRTHRVPSTADWFEGSVQELELYDPGASGGSMIWSVWFDAGSRAKPHAHSFDQTLHVTEGAGILATETTRRTLAVGDWVTIPAGTWHWHGALPDRALCHVTVQRPGSTDWAVQRRDYDQGYDGEPFKAQRGTVD